jgi:hypothetical protein
MCGFHTPGSHGTRPADLRLGGGAVGGPAVLAVEWKTAKRLPFEKLSKVRGIGSEAVLEEVPEHPSQPWTDTDIQVTNGTAFFALSVAAPGKQPYPIRQLEAAAKALAARL